MKHPAERLSSFFQLLGLYRPHRRFKRLKQQTGGMLPYEVYTRLYEEAFALPDLDIIEVGGAGGAGSIALAWGLRDSGKTGNILVVEKCERGSRDSLGDYASNLQRLVERFETFGVGDFVQIFPHSLTFENGSEVLGMFETRRIGALVHDADGRVDRDFLFFWPSLIDGGLIVVDDYDDRFQREVLKDGRVRWYGKKALTVRLLDQMQAWGLFEPTWQCENTVFGIKPPGADFGRFDQALCDLLVQENAAECRRREAEETANPAAG